MKRNLLMWLLLCVAALGLMFAIRSAADSTGRQADSPFASAPTNMLGYLERVNATLKANTAASNMTDQQAMTLMGEAAKTNLGAELLSRSSLYSYRAATAADIAMTVRVLEHLRAGRTDEAIRKLEAQLETDVSMLGMFLDASATVRMPTSNHLDSIQFAKDYWQKFPRSTTNNYGVNHALSLLDKK